MVIKPSFNNVFYDTSYVSNNTTFSGRYGMGLSKATRKHLESIVHPFMVTTDIDKELGMLRRMMLRDQHKTYGYPGARGKYNRLVTDCLDVLDTLYDQKTVVPNPDGSIYRYFRSRNFERISDADCSLIAAATLSAMQVDTILFTRDFDLVRLARCINGYRSPLRYAPLHLAVANVDKNVMVGYGRYREATL